MLSLLGPLCEADGPPGREAAVVRLIREHLAAAGVPHAPAPMGGLMAGDLHGKPLRLAFAAAVDEPGLMLCEPVENGIAHAYRLGALPAAAYAGRRIRTLRGQPGLVLPLDEAEKSLPPRWELRVDLGSAEAKLGAGDGAFAVFDEPFAGEAPRVTGKALGDRPACALLADLAADDASKTLGCAFIFYAQGQLGEHGLRLALRALAPQAFVVVRGVRHAPQVDKSGSAVLAESGPVLVLRRDASVSHPSLIDACERAADAAGVAVQQAVLLSEKPAHPPAETALAGIRRLELGYPLMEAECARQCVDLRDLEALRRLLRTLVGAELDA
jgi:putative aminopeptidase FrvX